MDPERVPQSIRDFIAAIVCPVCATPKAQGVMVKIMFQQPNFYQVGAHCLRCHHVYGWNFTGPPPSVAFQPRSEPTPNEVAVPQWVRDIMPPFAPQENPPPPPIPTPDPDEVDDGQPGADSRGPLYPEIDHESDGERAPTAPETEHNGGSQEGA